MNFPFLDGDVPRSTSYGVYISQFVWFARVSSHVDDFNIRNKILTAKLLRQGYRYHKIRKAFSKFYRRHFDIVSKYNIGLKTLLLQYLSEPDGSGALPAFIWEIAFLTILMWLGLVVLQLVIHQTDDLDPSQTQHWEAFGSALTRPSALRLHSLTFPLHHFSRFCHLQHRHSLF